MISRKTKFVSIAFLLMFTLSAFVVLLPTVSAQDVFITYPIIDAVPNPIGVNQQTLINTGNLQFLNIADDGWNVTIHVVDPTGDEYDLITVKTFSTGTIGVGFTPEIPGTYELTTIFPQQDYRGDTYLASVSEVLELEVLENDVATYPGHFLPTQYWYRPVDVQLREWWTIMGNWLAQPQNMYAPLNDYAPDSPHILWQMPIGDTQGGLVSTFLGPHGVNDGDAYEGKFSGRIVVNGILYVNKQWGGFGASPEPQSVVAIDIHKGEILWEKIFPYGDGRVDFGQVYYHDSINNRGAHSYIVFTEGGGFFGGGSQSWIFCDALTGDYRFNITDVPSGSNYYGLTGEIYKYDVDNIGNSTHPDWRLLRWSTRQAVQAGAGGGFTSESWAPAALGDVDGTMGWDLNVSIPEIGPGEDLPGSLTKVFIGDKVIGQRVTLEEVNLWAVSLSAGHEGSLLYNSTWHAPDEWVDGNLTIGGIGQAGWVSWSAEEQVAVFFTKENRVHYAFDLSDDDGGDFLYETPPQFFVDAYSDTVTETFGPDRIIYDGKLISATVGGIVYTYDARDGTPGWNYTAEDPYTETYISNNWWIIPLFATDGKIYFGSLEHSSLNPKPRGAPMFALNAADGSVVWRANGLFRQTRWGGRAVIGDSIITTQDTYDQQIYGIGKGPSAMEVTCADAAAIGRPVLICGSVTDVSPGTQNAMMYARFPNGVPVVADESMTDMMLYVYKQFEKPDTTGVEVRLLVKAPGASQFDWVDSATTDEFGNFGFSYSPQSQGVYEIKTQFVGTDSYYPSEASAYLAAGPALGEGQPPETEPPTTTEPPTETEPPTTTEPPTETETPTETAEPTAEQGLPLTEILIGAAVAVAVVIGIGAYWVLRKGK